jgi:1-phosphatidylinositol phosphodiesterase
MKTGFVAQFRRVGSGGFAGESVSRERRCWLIENPVVRVMIVAFCTALGIYSPSTLADNRSWYSGETAETPYPNWMRWVPDDVPLAQISFPSTHDTMALYWGAAVETQSMPLEEQLRAGIRALDIRARHINDGFTIYHGDFPLFVGFSDILRTCNAFLDQNPSETILLWVGSDGVPGPSNNTRDYYETFLAYRNSVLGAKISRTIVGHRYDAPLGEARGKIVIIENFPCESCEPDAHFTCESCGLNGHGSAIMNRDGGSTVFATAVSMNNRWDDIEEHFELIDDAGPYMFQNSLAGSGGVFPIDVANGFLGIEGMNSRALKYLFYGNQNRTGLLWMDFPGSALISAVIAHNMRFATNLPAMADDFGKMVEQISYATTDDGEDESATRAIQLKVFLDHILPEQHWSVLVSATPGGDNWGFSVAPDGLFHKTDWIDGYSHVAINAQKVNADITPPEILAYLIPQRLAGLSGDAIARASGVRALLESHFPWARWNVAVKRFPFDSDHWGKPLDAAASVSVPVADDGELYIYTAWATTGFNRAPVANGGSDYAANEGSVITFNASASTDPDGDPLQYRWDFDGNGIWDTARSTSPIASWTYGDEGLPLAKLEVFDGVLAHTANISIKIYNVAPEVEAGGLATAGKDLKLKRECHFIDPGADTWSIEVRYGDGSPSANFPAAAKTFVLEHTYSAPGEYEVQIRVLDDDGEFGAASFQVRAGANSPPIAGNDLIEISSATAGSEIRLSIAKLLSNDTDPDSDPLSLKEFAAQSANLQNIRRDGGWLFYRVPQAPAAADSFTYTVGDSAGAVSTATVQIALIGTADPPPNLIELARLPDGTVRLVFAGIPGRSYVIQASTILSSPDWRNLGTVTAAGNGFVTFHDTEAPNHASRFYRTISAD